MSMLKSLFRFILARLGWVQPPVFISRVMPHHPSPNQLPEGVVVVVKDEEHEKWACLRCPGGCGEKIQLSLNPQRRPRWSVVQNRLDRPTITPSIRMTNKCACHFWVREGKVKWCADSGRKHTDR